MPLPEVGERHAWLCLSGNFPARASKGDERQPGEGLGIKEGSDGQAGSGVYSVFEKGQPLAGEGFNLLKQYRKDGVVEKTWAGVEEEFKRITGKTRLDID